MNNDRPDWMCKPRLYIIGSITGKDNNIDEFHQVARELRAHGYSDHIPHENFVEDNTRQEMLQIILRQLTQYEIWHGDKRCYFNNLKYDGVALLDSWKKSKEARLACDVCMAIDIPYKPWREWIEK